jgi:hypothetical protein
LRWLLLVGRWLERAFPTEESNIFVEMLTFQKFFAGRWLLGWKPAGLGHAKSTG